MVEADRLTVMMAPRKVAQKNDEVNALRPRMLGFVNCRRADNGALVGVIAAKEKEDKQEKSQKNKNKKKGKATTGKFQA